MISEEEINDLQLLMNQSVKIATDFCILSIESLKDDINPKIFISAGNKLNVNPVQIEKAIHALLSIYLKAAEKGFEEQEFREILHQASFSTILAQSITDTYLKNTAVLKESLKKLAIKVLEYKDLDWRFDILTKTRSISDVVDPVITMQLKAGEEGSPTLQNHHLQVDPSTLIYMTESLEEALQQARSHHIRKFKKQKKTT